MYGNSTKIFFDACLATKLSVRFSRFLSLVCRALKWFCLDRRRSTLPLAVTLKRLETAFLVFNLGIILV